MIELSAATLPALSRRLDVPTYDRASLRPSIVHIGVGGFHRAHQAVYLDELARAGVTEWGEVGVGLRTAHTRSALIGQDGLFTVTEMDSDGERCRVVGAMSDCLFGPDDPGAVLRRLAEPATRLVTMTITGDGYNLGPAGEFAADQPDVLRDLEHPLGPSTWFGYLVEALRRRRAAGLGGFTVLSCDNIADSGQAARTALLGFAALRDETLARWIERNVTFPGSMVDRITPGADDGLQQLVARRFGVRDRAPVATETFTQWVVEDDFCEGRPPLEDVGVQLVPDVAPHKLLKTRLLNGTHSAVAYLGWLAGHRTTAEVVSNPTMRAFVIELMRTEVAPLLPPVVDMPVSAYVESVLDRLGNESVADPLSRLCRRGSTKVPSYVLPSLRETRQLGRPAPLLTLAVAAWFRYLRGTDLRGRPIEVQDAMIDQLRPAALRGGRDPGPLLAERAVMGSLGDDLVVRRELRGALVDLERGVEFAVLRRLTNARSPLRVSTRRSPISAHATPDLIS